MRKVFFAAALVPWLLIGYSRLLCATCNDPLTSTELGVVTTGDPRIPTLIALDILEQTANILAKNNTFHNDQAAIDAVCVLNRILATRIDIIASYT